MFTPRKDDTRTTPAIHTARETVEPDKNIIGTASYYF